MWLMTPQKTKTVTGTVGTIYNAGLWLLTAVGILIVNSGEADASMGSVAGFWYVLAFVAAQSLAVLAFYSNCRDGEGCEA